VYWTFLRGDPALTNSVMSTNFDRVLVALWPSWLFLIADPEERNVTLHIASIAVNALLYGALGWLMWLGLNGSRAILGAAGAIVLAGWYFLLSWYIGE
jgi:hypothetical protein